MNGKDKPAIGRAIGICLAEHNQDAFMRFFMLVALGTVLCPGAQNFFNLKYVEFLMRSKEKELDCECASVFSRSEVRKFLSTINSPDVSKQKASYFILPVFQCLMRPASVTLLFVFFFYKLCYAILVNLYIPFFFHRLCMDFLNLH